MTRFQTPEYEGTWFPYSPTHDHQHRKAIEAYLREQLKDPQGKLTVNETGPHWEGEVGLKGLSYAHSGSVLGLVYSFTHSLGVDVESMDRVFRQPFANIAQRFFHPVEAKQIIEADSPVKFLEIWGKKEAYAKLTRLGLSQTVGMQLSEIKDVLFKTLTKTPVGYQAWIALQSEN